MYFSFLPGLFSGWLVCVGFSIHSEALSFFWFSFYMYFNFLSSVVSIPFFLVWVHEECGDKGPGRFLLIIFPSFSSLFCLFLLCLNGLIPRRETRDPRYGTVEYSVSYCFCGPYSLKFVLLYRNHDGGLKLFRPFVSKVFLPIS